MENLCRLCLKMSSKLENLFSEHNGQVIASLVTNICLIKILENDKKPKGICRSCLEIIQNAHDLRALAMFNDENFNFVMDDPDVLNVNVKEELPSDDEDNFFNSPDSPNVFVQLKTESTSEEEDEEENSDDDEDNSTSDSDSYSSESVIVKRKRGRPPGSSKSYKSSSSSKAKVDYNKRIRSCNWCDEVFQGYHKLRKHEANYHPEEFRQYKEARHKNTATRHLGCSFCHMQFSATKDMNLHIKTVHGFDTDLLSYYCAHCPYSSNQKSSLESHVKTLHFGLPAKDIKCGLCGIGFVNKQNLNKHLANKHQLRDPELIYCDRCTFTSKIKGKVTAHMQRVHLKAIKDFLCAECDVICQNKKERDLHHFAHCDIVEKIDQSLEKLTCTICREQYGEREDLLNHLESHRNDVEFTTTPCVLCYKPVSGYEHLLNHTKEFHATKNCYRCRECNRSYPYGMKFLSHIQNHKNSNQTHLCPECGQSFRTVCLLNKHIRVDHRQVLKCPYCPDKVYKSLVAYRFHVESHTNTCKYKCDLCPKSFSVYNRFKHHYAFHLNRTINQCHICQKCFEKPETLKTHLKRHDGTLPRNFPCGFCEKRFASRWAQENHERSHTKEKPYHCKFCSSQYSQKGDLVKHLAKVHVGENVYECDQCPESFRLIKDLKFHTMTAHALPSGDHPKSEPMDYHPLQKPPLFLPTHSLAASMEQHHPSPQHHHLHHPGLHPHSHAAPKPEPTSIYQTKPPLFPPI